MPFTDRRFCRPWLDLRPPKRSPRHRPGVDAVYRAFVAHRIEELTRNIAQGGPREAAIRALLYIRMPEGVADERGFRLLERMREEAGGGLSARRLQGDGARSILQPAAR